MAVVYHDKEHEGELLDEVLSVLYEKWERREVLSPQELAEVQHGDHHFSREAVDHVVGKGFVVQRNGHVELTESGYRQAKMVIRCARLAERLLVDVLRVRDDLVEPSACRLEHNLSNEVADSICTLLGHPKTCPHGHAIPPGECCRRAKTEVQPIVRPLSSLRSGEEGTVAYISSRFHSRLTRLASLGIMPGQVVQIKQVLPSFVISFGETELALEQSVADEIYLRTSNHKQGP